MKTCLSDLRTEIDNMTYAEMFRLRRFEPIGSKYFDGEAGDYFLERMAKLEKRISQEEKVSISKSCLQY